MLSNFKDNLYKIFAVSTLVSGLAHLLIVSVMHRENFVELWFFTVIGLIQIGVVWYMKTHKNNLFTPIFVATILNGGMVVLWLFTRTMNAPFASYSESVAGFDTLITILEIVAVVTGLLFLKKKKTPQKGIVIALVFSVLFGAINYSGAKGSEKIFKSIPISQSSHKHSVIEIFRAPKVKSTTQTSGDGNTTQQNQMEMMGMDMETHMQMINKEVTTPESHDNSDGHHDI
jgi:hypothetical protein